VLTDPLMTTEQIASALNMSPKAVRHALRRQQIPGAVKKGQQWRLPERALHAYIDSLNGTAHDRRHALLDVAERLQDRLTTAWARAKEQADALQALRDIARDLAAVLRENGEPK
jgi:excisionase family DNA binding protein